MVLPQTRNRVDLLTRSDKSASGSTMDAIRKKMQSLKAETDGLYATIQKFEDDTNDKLTKATESLEEKEKMYKEVEADVSALTRRIMLMEEEAKKSEQTLADTVTRLANKSKEADSVLKKAKVFESKCMNNEVTIRSTTRT